MTIYCNECDSINSKPTAATTLNGAGEVCPDCFSENIKHVQGADDALDAMLASIRRTTKVREFMIGGAQ